MKPEEFERIKEKYQEYKDLMKEQDELRETLETKVDTYANLSRIADRLEIIEDDLFGINNEDDIYISLADSCEFERIKCDTDKKLYFFYGIVREDKDCDYDNKYGDDYVIFVPRYSKLSPFIKYYVLLWDLVDSRGHILVPLKKYEEFKKEHYVYDIGEEINQSFLSNDEYNMIRHYGNDTNSNYEDAYDALRLDLFKNYVQSETEEEAVKELAKKYKL